MPNIQTRDFTRIVDAGNLSAAIAEVTSDLNAFLVTFTNLGDVLDIRYHTGLASKYGERLIHKATVIYVEP